MERRKLYKLRKSGMQRQSVTKLIKDLLRIFVLISRLHKRVSRRKKIGFPVFEKSELINGPPKKEWLRIFRTQEKLKVWTLSKSCENGHYSYTSGKNNRMHIFPLLLGFLFWLLLHDDERFVKKCTFSQMFCHQKKLDFLAPREICWSRCFCLDNWQNDFDGGDVTKK